MYFVIYDMELNHSEYKNRNIRHRRVKKEPIEIGAVKLVRDGTEFLVHSKFASFVRPTLLKEMNPHVTELTGIQSAQVENAPPLEDVMRDFSTFAGPDAMLVSWGTLDKAVLYESCDAIGMSNDWFKDNHLDLQKQVSALYGSGSGHLISLASGMRAVGLEPGEGMHNALVDAEHTARVFASLYERLDLSDCLSRETRRERI
ncbi:exonuclease domain-containing protein [Neobacillus mesonae]|nr:exonuclease domain-containing protein [Neobacillus mesonae]